jgi:hypothetical protein
MWQVFGPHTTTHSEVLSVREDVLAVDRGLVVEARGQAGEAFGLGGLVAVDHVARQLLAEAFDDRALFRQAPRGAVAVQVGQGLVDFGVVLQHAQALADLDAGALGRLHAAVQLAPGGLGDAGAHAGRVAGQLVGFEENGVVEDLVGLRQHLDDRDHVALRVEARLQVEQRRVGGGESGHCGGLSGHGFMFDAL